MIDWRVSSSSKETGGDGWHFPSFDIQEMLLPMINVGFEMIDSYGDTTFGREDCFRLKRNISFILDSGRLGRPEFRYDRIEGGISTIRSSDVETCLLRLQEAADQVITSSGVLTFYGD
ncbi:MAG: hypothetical protein CJBNEKGG_03395 [Prosthecobacter sp.]|nr:hypothetical protein [Prosthecobacter sp.]